MNKPLVIFFAKKKLNSITLVNEVNKNNIKVIQVDTVKEFIAQLKKKKVSMVILEHQQIQNCEMDSNFFYGFVSLANIPLVLSIGDEKKLSNIKEINFDAIISQERSLEEKFNEINVYCEACKIILTSENRIKKFSDLDAGSGILQKKIEEELHLKNRRISTLYMQIIEYKNILRKSFHDWKTLDLPISDDRIRRFHFSLKSYVKETHSEWNVFSEHFNEVHPLFYKKLKERASELSDDNLKMCAYIKMGLSNNEIASYMNIMHGSVKRAQLRIKNRLNLSRNRTLRQFIKEI